jgi:hypothetical protein
MLSAIVVSFVLMRIAYMVAGGASAETGRLIRSVSTSISQP